MLQVPWCDAPTVKVGALAAAIILATDLLLSFALTAAADAKTCTASMPCVEWPSSAGMIDVRTFGARGDGVADDTHAIRAALAAAEKRAQNGVWTPIVYVPAGTYRVTDTIVKRDANGMFDSGFMLQGAGRDQTIIRLDTASPGFGDPQNPRAILYTASHLWKQGGAYGGGKDWPNLGEGNQAFQNTIRDLTLSIGGDNPGAIAIDYIGNNSCELRNLKLMAENGSGHTALALRRKWPGPCLIEGVSVAGFAVGLHTAHSIYSVTLVDLAFEGQRRAGIVNEGNVLSIAHMHGKFNVPALINARPDGMVVVVHARLSGSAAAAAFENQGVLRLSDVTLDGYRTSGLDGAPAQNRDLTFVARRMVTETGPPATVARPPALPTAFAGQKVNVTAFGARGDDEEDDSDAFQAAFDSGASVVYLPFGRYRLSKPVILNAALRWLVGMNAEIQMLPAIGGRPAFDTAQVRDALVINDVRLRFMSGKVASERGPFLRHSGPAPLVLRSILESGSTGAFTMVERATNGGPLILMNVCCSRFLVKGPAPVQAYQLNTEGEGVRIANEGSPLSILGLKTEGINTAVATTSGGRTEILGGLLYPVGRVPANQPAFIVDGAMLRLTIVDTAFVPTDRYTAFIVDAAGRSAIEGCRRPNALGTLVAVTKAQTTASGELNVDGNSGCR